MHGETGIGYNHDLGIVDADPEWWSRKIQQNPVVAKFRERGSYLPFEQELLFSDIVATGGHSWAPSFGLIPPEMQEGADDEEDNVEQESEPTINHETLIAGGIESGGVGGGSQRKSNLIHSRICAKKMNMGEKIAQSINDMVGTLREREVGRHAHMPQKYTISECMDVLHKIDGIEEGDGLWVFAFNLFLKPSVRELWSSIRKDETRFIWLCDTMENYMEKRASSMSFQGSRGDTRDDAYSS